MYMKGGKNGVNRNTMIVN